MEISYYQVNAFTKSLFGGNPAGVCPLDSWLGDEVLQEIAAENNLSETAYFVRRGDNYELRWFTPKIEVDLCGHATLASAFVIFNYLDKSVDEVRFETKSGLLTARRQGELMVMNFPAWEVKKCSAPEKLLEALGGESKKFFRFSEAYSACLAVYDSIEAVKSLKPDMELLEKVDCLGVSVTAPGLDCDFVSRFFAPGAGVPEDPVTGSMHCALVPYWSGRLDKKKLHSVQLSQRGGELYCEFLGDRVSIAGYAVTYLKGIINLPA